jgi:alpha-1,2-mannosyltransferase
VFAALVMTPASLVSWTVATWASTIASTVVVVLTTWWLVAPIARRKGWTPWFAVGVALPFVLETEPVRETLGFGQVNLFLVALVLADVLAVRRGWRWAGVGTGIAAAVKLTPLVFVLYFFFTGRRRAAWTGAGTFVGATVLAAVVAPSMAIEYWGTALFQTSRIGHLDGTSNQSLMGLLARLAVPGQPSKAVWALLCLATVVVGLVRAVRAHRAGDEVVGIALTGLVGCLVSPISWTHHFWWIVPAAVALADVALGRRISAEGSPFLAAHPVGVRRTAAAALAVVVGSFGSAMVWFFHSATPGEHFGGAVGFVVEDAYVLIAIGLLLFTPIRAAAAPAAEPDLDAELSAALAAD